MATDKHNLLVTCMNWCGTCWNLLGTDSRCGANQICVDSGTYWNLLETYSRPGPNNIWSFSEPTGTCREPAGKFVNWVGTCWNLFGTDSRRGANKICSFRNLLEPARNLQPACAKQDL